MDDDPKLMEPFLKDLGVSLPAVMARDFAYDLVSVMALPSNWLISSKGTEMFYPDNADLEKWFELASQAIEKSARPAP